MSTVEKFKFWCNKILPLVYDDSLSYMEFLGKVYEKLNETIDAVNDNTAAIAEFDQRINQFMQDEQLARQNWESAEALKWAAFQAMFINEYDPEEEYVLGDICSRGTKMYVANAATTGTFDPSKWDEIVLSDYLAEYVADAKAEMQGQYDDFLEDYQRQFGIVQTTGDSTTDAMSQNAVTTFVNDLYNSTGMKREAFTSSNPGDLNAVKRGIYSWTSSNVPTNAPQSGKGVCICLDNRSLTSTTESYGGIQMCVQSAGLYIRSRNNSESSYSAWSLIAYPADIAAAINAYQTAYGFDVGAFTGTDVYDLNTMNRSIHYWSSTHAPTNAPVSGESGMCITFDASPLSSTSTTSAKIQLCVQTGGVYIRDRKHNTSAYSGWSLIQTGGDSFNITNTTFTSATPNYGKLDTTDPRPLHFSFDYQGAGTIDLRLYKGAKLVYHPAEFDVDSDEVKHLEITAPACVGYADGCSVIISGSTSLTILKGSIYRGVVCKRDTAILFNNHCGAEGLYPQLSYNGVAYAAKLGFSTCICIPKRTSDGVWVCFHDDDTIATKMRMPDGSAIPSEYDLPVSSLTYSQLLQFSIGARLDPAFSSYKILTMDDFFKICSLTGMRPIFSIHPGLSSSDWDEINVLLRKWNLYGQLSVKTGSSSQQDLAKQKTDVYAHIWMYGIASSWDVVATVQASSLDPTTDRIVCEFMQQSFDSPDYVDNVTTQFENVKAAGYIPSLAISDAENTYILGFINRGMKEFTTGDFYSIYDVTN